MNLILAARKIGAVAVRVKEERKEDWEKGLSGRRKRRVEKAVADRNGVIV